MWNKIYLIKTVVFTSLTAFLSFYAHSWLQSIGTPSDAAAGYEYYAGLLWIFLIVTSIVLMILANWVFAKSSRSWALWMTFGYFTFFVMIRYFWLDQTFFNFTRSHGLTERFISFAPLFGFLWIVGAGFLTFGNQLLLTKMMVRLYPQETKHPELQELTDSDLEDDKV